MLADLGVAYALRADTQNRDVDFAYAIEYLSRSLKAKPNSAVAVFNRAIIYERTYLYGPAAGEWRQFLKLETSGAWRAEAQLRLANLEQKLAARQTALARTSDKDPESLLRRHLEQGGRLAQLSRPPPHTRLPAGEPIGGTGGWPDR